MNLITIEQERGATITDIIFTQPEFFLHKKITYKDNKIYVRVWKRFFKWSSLP